MTRETTTMNGVYKVMDSDGILQAHLFHYVKSEERARAIMQQGMLIPHREEGLPLLFPHYDPVMRTRVNVTDVRPEEGRRVIAGATGLPEDDIAYGLELLVPASGLVQAVEYLPRAYQMYTQDPVPVKVLRLWNMDRVESRRRRGTQRVHRYATPIPHAQWVPAA